MNGPRSRMDSRSQDGRSAGRNNEGAVASGCASRRGPSPAKGELVARCGGWVRFWLGLIAASAAATVGYQGWEMLLGVGRPMLQGVDDSHYYFWVRSAVVDRDWDFANELAAAPTLTEPMRARLQAQAPTPAGLTPNKYAVGWAVVSWPLIEIAHGLARLGGGPTDGWQPIYFIVLWAGHLALNAWGLVVAAGCLGRFVPARAAWVGVGVGWAASSLVFYSSARISMVHGLLFTLVVLVTELTLRLREAPTRGWRWVALGAAAGLAVITRPTAAVYLVFPAVVVIDLLRAGGRGWTGSGHGVQALAGGRKIWLGFAGAVGAGAAVVAMQLWAWRCVYGSWLVYSYGDEGFGWTAPHLAEVLFSPLHGWFYWHPLLLVGLVAAAWLAWRRRLPASWLVAVAATVYLNAAWHCWWFGSSFGNRAFEGATFTAMAGLAGIWAALEKPSRARLRRVWAVGCGLAVLLNVAWLAAFMGGRIPREAPVTYGDLFRSWGAAAPFRTPPVVLPVALPETEPASAAPASGPGRAPAPAPVQGPG